MFVAVAQGFVDGGQVSFLILFGYFWIYSIMRTGALNALISKLISKKEKSAKLFVPISILLWALAGSTYGELDTVWGLLPIFIAVAIAFGYDAIVGVCMCYGAVSVGFASATTNPFTVGIAQSIAELPLFSGMVYRCIIFVVFVGTWMFITLRYASKVKKDPTKSPMYDLDQNSELRAGGGLEDFGTIDARKVLSIIALVVSLGVVIYGSIKFDWDMPEMAAMFIWLAIVVGIISGFDSDTICKNFLEGCKKMMSAMIIIGLAQSISSIMSDGRIIDTVVHGLADLVAYRPCFRHRLC